ncbi:hypothetical protein [Tateyamaria sp.]|uniref:hypothetical protein n=1 Tax=Tateyamaria sp. TaxID=1929288 RepID=UPI003B21EB3C
MRFVLSFVALWFSATAALANADIDRLVDAMGMPALVRAFSEEGIASSPELDEAFLNGQGGAVFAETVRKLYDPARLEAELRTGLYEVLDPDMARTALLFAESDLGQRIVTLEVQGRQAMLDADVQDMVKAAGDDAGAAVTDFLAARNLVERNTEAAVVSQVAFFDGLAETITQSFPPPDIEGQRAMIAADTERWLKGYYALVQSALNADEIETYTAFWATEVGTALDDAVFEVFGQSYEAISYGLGQAVGRLVPPNEL